jgi:hypothetical protein
MVTNVQSRSLKRVLIKEEYVDITGDTIEAIIIDQMICWSESVSDFDKFIAEEKERLGTALACSDGNLLLYGWIRKSAAEIKDDIMCNDSARNVNRKLDDLVSKGLLFRRNNPDDHYDHKYQYRLNFKAIISALDTYGWTLGEHRAKLQFCTDKT